MDVEQTIEFILKQQAKFEEGLQELRRSQVATQRLIRILARAGQERIEAIETRQDFLEERQEQLDRKFDAFIERFDAFLRGRGNGHQEGQ
jgi:light-regulated signal transduction histidine kinase (bacteriophytochrome)